MNDVINDDVISITVVSADPRGLRNEATIGAAVVLQLPVFFPSTVNLRFERPASLLLSLESTTTL